MFGAILAIMLLPVVDLGRSKGLQFRPLGKIAFYIFVANFLVLMQLGAKHVESPFIEFGQISTVLYFSYFILIVPFVSLVENTLIDLNTFKVSRIKPSSGKVPKGIRYFHATRRLSMYEGFDISFFAENCIDLYTSSKIHYWQAVNEYASLKAYVIEQGYNFPFSFNRDHHIPDPIKTEAASKFSRVVDLVNQAQSKEDDANTFLRVLQRKDVANTNRVSLVQYITDKNIARNAWNATNGR